MAGSGLQGAYVPSPRATLARTGLPTRTFGVLANIKKEGREGHTRVQCFIAPIFWVSFLFLLDFSTACPKPALGRAGVGVRRRPTQRGRARHNTHTHTRTVGFTLPHSLALLLLRHLAQLIQGEEIDNVQVCVCVCVCMFGR